MVGRLRPVSLGLAIVGLAIAGYLTYVHSAGIESVCAIAHGCQKVQTSEWSELVGVPVALLGLIGFVLIIGALAVDGEEGRFAAVAATWVGLAFSLYLTYREIFDIKAICIWCTTINGILVILAGLTTYRFLKAEHPE
jgi:uncharacterized membrane protein